MSGLTSQTDPASADPLDSSDSEEERDEQDEIKENPAPSNGENSPTVTPKILDENANTTTNNTNKAQSKNGNGKTKTNNGSQKTPAGSSSESSRESDDTVISVGKRVEGAEKSEELNDSSEQKKDVVESKDVSTESKNEENDSKDTSTDSKETKDVSEKSEDSEVKAENFNPKQPATLDLDGNKSGKSKHDLHLFLGPPSDLDSRLSPIAEGHESLMGTPAITDEKPSLLKKSGNKADLQIQVPLKNTFSPPDVHSPSIPKTPTNTPDMPRKMISYRDSEVSGIILNT